MIANQEGTNNEGSRKCRCKILIIKQQEQDIPQFDTCAVIIHACLTGITAAIIFNIIYTMINEFD